MATLNELKHYLNYEFSSGPYTGDDYKSFERKYINYLKTLSKENGWELCRVLKNHYGFSAFFKYKGKFVYFSISDVRFFTNEWYTHILVRTAENDTDYTGGSNCYTSLPLLNFRINSLFDGN
ncbi:MAG: hypothetical protein SPL13_01075 [Clostridia bacterium]|nr:hypothetical protein [Clostridia bacterium]